MNPTIPYLMTSVEFGAAALMFFRSCISAARLPSGAAAR